MKQRDYRKKPATVLVVVSDQIERSALCREIGKEFPVLAASRFDDASHLARVVSPDLIVVGVATSEVVETAAWLQSLRTTPETKRMAVLILANQNVTADTLSASVASPGFDFRETTILACPQRNGRRVREELHRIIGPCAPLRSTRQRGWFRRSEGRVVSDSRLWWDRCDSVDIAAFAPAPAKRLIA